MSDSDAFSTNNPLDPNGKPSAAPNSAEQNPSVGSEFIGEGKKYATVDDAINSIAPAQEHILNLEKEMGELREELTKRSAAEEILNRIDSASNSGQDTPAAGLDKEAVAQLVNETVSQRDAKKILDVNKKEVNDKLAEVYKDKAKEVVSNKARELGVSVEYLQSTAEQSPKAFYQMIGLSNNSSNENESMNFQSEVNTQNLEKNLSGSIQHGTYKYYQALRKENPSKYYTVEVQRDLHKHAKELGENFYK